MRRCDADLVDARLGGPDERTRRGETGERARVVALDARRQVVALPAVGGTGETVELRHHRRGAFVAGDAIVRSEMLPALLEAGEGGERHRLDLLARLSELAPARLLEQAARAPPCRGAVATEDAAHEHLLLLPLVEPALDPARLEVVARADVVDGHRTGERDEPRQHLAPRGLLGEHRFDGRVRRDARAEGGDVAGGVVHENPAVLRPTRCRDARRDQSAAVQQRGERITATPLG